MMKRNAYVIGGLLAAVAVIMLAVILVISQTGSNSQQSDMVTKSAGQMLIQASDMPPGWIMETPNLLSDPPYPVKEYSEVQLRVNGPGMSTAVLCEQVIIFNSSSQADSTWSNYKANMTSFQSSSVPFHFDQCIKFSVGAGFYQSNLYAFHEKNIIGFLEVGKAGYDLSSGFEDQMLTSIENKVS